MQQVKSRNLSKILGGKVLRLKVPTPKLSGPYKYRGVITISSTTIAILVEIFCHTSLHFPIGLKLSSN